MNAVRLFCYMLIQTSMMVFGQVFFKLGMQALVNFTWTWHCIWHQILLNGWVLLGVTLLILANLFWLYLLKIYPFSVIYPLTSLGFALGMLVGWLIFHETVDWLQWFGVILIIGGCFLINFAADI